MFKVIIKKELLENLVSYKFAILTIACFVLIGFSNYSMYKTYRQNVEDYNLRTATTGDVLLRKAPSPLSIYINGLQELMERTFMYQRGMPEPMEVSAGFNLRMYRSLFPVMDFAYLVKVVLSFMAMVLGFDLLCGEKMRGTLRLMISNALTKNTVILGKMTGNAITLAIPFILSSLFFYLLLQFAPDVSFSFEDHLRLFLIFAFSLFYLVIFLMAAIMVSGLVYSPKASIIGCFFIWVTLVFVLPNILALTAKKYESIPDVNRVTDSKKWAQEEFKKVEGQHPAGWVQEQTMERFRMISMDFRNKLSAYTSLAKRLNRYTPAGAYVLLASGIAKCGMDDEHNFRNALFQFMQSAKAGPDKENIFSIKEFPLRISLYNSILDILSLTLFMLLFYLGAYTAFVKYDIR